MFIDTEPIDRRGKTGEKLVWNALQAAFANRECLGYWRYPIFSQLGEFRKEPDLLIADREWGLIVIEVKSISIEQIVRITGHRWEYQNFYTPAGNPYQQAESQLFSLLEYSENEPSLFRQITGKAMVALPAITQQQWQAREFHKLPTNPPILFKNFLTFPSHLCQIIQQTTPVIKGNKLSQNQWQLLLSILSGTPTFCRPNHRVLTGDGSRGKILQKLRSHLSRFDLQQEKIGKQIPPGPQCIRGIAGSGKTAILCQKAAHMHLKHPDWKIAFVFFSRSLYQVIIEQIDRWLRYFSHNQQEYQPDNPNLKVFHAWGSRQQPGFYRTLCKLAGIPPLTVNDTASNPPNEALAEACLYLLREAAIPQQFDAILIDEGQDLIADQFKFEGKQPFYWLAYQALRPVELVYSQQKRLIWTYDEAQSLDSLKIPTAREIFGEELGHLVTGQYVGSIKKTETMDRCYRTPCPIITAAYAISMGLLRPRGILAAMTLAEEWEKIGYTVEGDFMPGRKITVKRPQEYSPHTLSELWQGNCLEFQTYPDRQQELTALVKNIKHNLRSDGLRPCREILVIVLGNYFDAVKLENYTANFLMKRGIYVFIPGNRQGNTLTSDPDSYNPNQFWQEGAVTISRIHRAKGNEADMVYIVGLDHIAKDESNIVLRNQLFIALTRTKAWVSLSGTGSYKFYHEVRRVLDSGDTFTFIFRPSNHREITVTEKGEFLKRYALGGRNFQGIDLNNANLMGVHLSQANLISANLRNANLQKAQLDGVKLIAADLSQANLAGCNLRNGKLMGANLQGANLQNADLTGANLRDADLTGANLQGAKMPNLNYEL